MQNKTKSAIFYFILLQPFLDLYWFYNGKLAELLPFTLPTIIRIMACGAIFLLFFSQKSNWQKLGQDKWLITYLVLLVVYSLLHLWHVNHQPGVQRGRLAPTINRGPFDLWLRVNHFQRNRRWQFNPNQFAAHEFH